MSEVPGDTAVLECINSLENPDLSETGDTSDDGSDDASGISDKSSDSSNFGTLLDLQRTKVNEITVDELKRCGHWDLDNPTPNDLTYEIHTLLRRERWQDLEDEDWEIIEPALRLTSAFLDSEASFVFFYSLINSNRVFFNGKQWENFYPRIGKTNPYKARGQTIEEVREEYDTAMEIIAKQLQLRFSDSRSAEGYTIHQRSRRVCFRTKKLGMVIGQGCNILMQKSIFLKPLHRLRKLPQTPSVISTILRIEFKMANVLGHEIAHVLESALRDAPPWNAFWRDQRVAELGRAWETEVYGGTIQWGRYLSPMAPLLSVKWPHWDTGIELSWGTRRLPKGSRTLYVVAMRHIGLLSSQRFWDRYRGSRNRKLLWCPRIIGIRQHYRRKKDRSWNRKRSSEVYEPDERGVVRRMWDFAYKEAGDGEMVFGGDAPAPGLDGTNGNAGDAHTYVSGSIEGLGTATDVDSAVMDTLS
ncbi:hypothetical protein MMC18_000488 [Xylographa bjoerkii]|nr:hypothetical protein [Xylographa bjoerkii]